MRALGAITLLNPKRGIALRMASQSIHQRSRFARTARAKRSTSLTRAHTTTSMGRLMLWQCADDPDAWKYVEDEKRAGAG